MHPGPPIEAENEPQRFIPEQKANLQIQTSGSLPAYYLSYFFGLPLEHTALR